jgi:FAD/FMN-containing dehydrogenase
MNRRNLLNGAAALLLAPAVPARAAQAAPRRRRPADADWPRAADWARLKEAVGGALVRPVSPYGPCESADAAPACLSHLKDLRNPYFLGDQPGGTQVSGYLDAWRPAQSAYAVAARNAADVAAAVDFARTHNLRLVVKGGGHSYQGTSNAPDSLLVWTRAMHAITLHEAFVPRGCRTAPVPAVTVEAGCMWIDAYDAVTTRAGRYVQGGGCATVGVAGLVQSGGFGSFSKRYGMASANLLEAEIVTADGRIRTVNPCQDPDLFWGLKGGGGGSLGVVTRLTLRTHDLPDKFGGLSLKVAANSDAAFRRLIDRFMGFYAESLMNPHWGEQASFGADNSLEVSMVFQGLDMAEAGRIWKPFMAWLAAAPDDFRITGPLNFGTMPARTWWDAEARRRRGDNSMIADDRADAPTTHAWWQGDQEQVSAFLHGYESLWMPASLLAEGGRGRLTEALFAASRHFAVSLHFNKGLAGAPPEAVAAAKDVATNPAVLDAFALAIIATGGFPPLPGLPGPPQDMALAHRNAQAVDRATDELRRVVPNPGSYVSESNYFNPRWQDAFWGRNYPRLRAAKAKYDPAGLFFVHHGVGSEAWSPDGFTRLRG